MNRYLLVLASLALAFFLATAVLGLSLGDVRNPADRTTQRRATVHRLSGIAAALAVVLVDCIAITYFVGTSRWCKEVVETYRLDPQFVVRGNRLKRATFPVATLSMLYVVTVVALGGAADPAASLRLPAPAGLSWAQCHLIAALAGVALLAMGFYWAWLQVDENQRLIGEVVAQVRRIRAAHGLEVD